MKPKKYHFCTHFISILLLYAIGIGCGIIAINTEKVQTQALYAYALIFSEAVILLYGVYIYATFALSVDEKGIRLGKAQDVILIEWDQVARISIREDLRTKRIMLRVTPNEYAKSKKIAFFRNQTRETLETDASMRYVNAIRTYYKGEITGLERLNRKNR